MVSILQQLSYLLPSVWLLYAQTKQPGINWLQLCRNPVVDTVIVEPCETLTTSGGYELTSEGQRVVGCILSAGVLLVADPTGVAFAKAQTLASTVGLCAGMTAPLTNPNNNPSSSSSTNNPLNNLIGGLLGNPTTTSLTNPASPHGDFIPSCSGDYYHPCKWVKQSDQCYFRGWRAHFLATIS
jgi:hypothetical protein